MSVEQEMLESLSKNWGWMLAMGILLVILGTIGLGATFALTLASVFIFGVLWFTPFRNMLDYILMSI